MYNNFERRDLNQQEIYEELRRDVEETLKEKFKLRTVDFNLKAFDTYKDIECPCVKIAPTGIVTDNPAQSMQKSKIFITAFLYVIYSKRSKDLEIYEVIDELLKEFNNKQKRNNSNGLTLRTEITQINYSNPLVLKEHSVAEIELEILTTT